MDKIRASFNKIPTPIQVIIYVGVSSILSTLIVHIQNIQLIDWRAILVIVLTVGVNIIAYLILRTKNG